MGKFYFSGEKKVRPDVYQNYTNVGGVELAGAINGIVAATIKSDWGPLGQVVTVENEREFNEIFGYGKTTDVVREIFRGGAIKAFVVRLGSNGTKGSAELMDSSGAKALELTARYEGTRKFSYIVRPVLGEDNLQEFLLLEGLEVLERYTFTKEKAAEELAEALNKSLYVRAKKTGGDGTLKDITQAEMKAGTNPEIDTRAYSNAFNLLEPYVFNCICVDTNETAVHLTLAAFTNRIYQNGTMNFAVIGEPSSVDFETRLKHAKAYNDYNIVFVGAGWKDLAGTTYDGYMAAARIAGLIAAVPSNESVTRRSIQGAVEILENLTNDKQERAIKNGMITLRYNAQGIVCIEKGITTLVSPEGQDDEGWKKIKRAKVRFELFQRMSDTLDKFIGKVPNDADSWALVCKTGRGIMREMSIERKIKQDFDMYLDPAYPPEGESAHFIIKVNDIDSLEIIYLNYHLRFSPYR